MNKGDVYFRGRPRSVHLKIGFASMERESEREVNEKEGMKEWKKAGIS